MIDIERVVRSVRHRTCELQTLFEVPVCSCGIALAPQRPAHGKMSDGQQGGVLRSLGDSQHPLGELARCIVLGPSHRDLVQAAVRSDRGGSSANSSASSAARATVAGWRALRPPRVG